MHIFVCSDTQLLKNDGCSIVEAEPCPPISSAPVFKKYMNLACEIKYFLNIY